MTSPAPGWGAGLPGFPRADGLWLPAVAVGGALAALGVGLHAKPLVLAGAAAAAIALGCWMPELVFALFLDAGGIKDAHVLSSLPIDLTVLTAAGVLAAIAIRCVRQGVPSIPLPAFLMVALAALVLASVLWSPDSSLGLTRALRFETLTLLGFLAPFALIRSRRSFMRLMIGLVVVGLLIASTAHPTNDVNKPLEVAGGIEIELGLDVGLGLLAALGYMLAAPKSKLRFLWLIPAGYMAWIAFASGSRGAVVAGGAALGFLFVRQYWSGIQSRLFIVALVAAVAGVLTVGGLGVAGLAAKKYQAVLFSSDTSQVLGLRQYLYHRGWEIAVHHPMGIGSGGFQAVTDLNYPHNILLELADEHGLLAVSLFILLVLAAWSSRMAAYRGARAESIMVGGLILFCLLESLGSFDINQDKPLWFALGLALALPRLATVP